ncbi:MAG: anti-sigma regulatory factor [Actinomycetota bacterium]
MAVEEALLVVPARSDLLSLLRAVVADLAARRGFSYDAIDDLRNAVSEAATFLLGAGSAASRLELRIAPTPRGLDVDLSTDAPTEAWPPPGADRSLAWQVLSALTDEAVLVVDGATQGLHLVKRSAPAG